MTVSNVVGVGLVVVVVVTVEGEEEALRVDGVFLLVNDDDAEQVLNLFHDNLIR